VRGSLPAIGGLDLNDVDYVLVGLFVATWVVAFHSWR
jgi:high-affinity nickel permease